MLKKLINKVRNAISKLFHGEKTDNSTPSATPKNSDETQNTTPLFPLEDYGPDDFLTLMNIYLEEWGYRVNSLWSKAFKLFYATIIVLFLPNLASYLGITLPNFPAWIFPGIAIVLSLTFAYVTIGYTFRLNASSNTYQNFIDLLPKELKRESIKNLKFGKLFYTPMSKILCLLMFAALLVLSVVMLIYYL